MSKIDYSKLTRVGKCNICTISLWKEAGNAPTVMPCYIEGCPYMAKNKRGIFEPFVPVKALPAS